jgi:radical SAM protein with 4Fe4S-binding SPASM domain
VTGGECLTYPGFEELYLYLHSLGCHVDVLTNASLLNDRWIRFFQDHKPIGIQVTVYGGDEDAYERVTGQRAFSTVLKNIQAIKDAGLPLKLSVTPNRILGEGVFDTICVARQFTKAVIVNQALDTPREETGRSHGEYDLDAESYVRINRFLRELDGQEIKEVPVSTLPPIGGMCHEARECGLSCSAGRSNFSIDWRGVMHPCSSLELIEGEPLKEGFLSAWHRVSSVACSWPRVPECEGCAYQSACTNCAARMLQFADPGKQPIALCERTRYMVQQGISQIPDCE